MRVCSVTFLIFMNCLSYEIKLSKLLLDNDNLQLIRLVLQSYLVLFTFTFSLQLLKFNFYRIVADDYLLCTSQLYLGTRKYGSTWALFPPVR
jgi:hypothetical protein